MDRLPFTSLLGSIQTEGETFSAPVTEDWLQGRTLFGGMGAALCLEAARRLAGRERPLRSMIVSYVAPVSPDAPVTLEPVILREGRNVTQVMTTLTQNGQVATVANFCFAQDFDSVLDSQDITLPEAKPREESFDFHSLGRGPVFLQHFDVLWANDVFPMTGAEKGESLVWVRHKDEIAGAEETAFIALADALPPSAMAMLKAPAPLSTMTWQLNIIDPGFTTEDGWWLTHARTQHVANGYASQEATFWNTEGKLAAIGTQNILIFG
ncbi:acyl-CoA thioesterase [Tepidicaulis sp. LMO-SS28]|uniref:acyl-CoA thioesterase n=1 Tax=Tepidicaulis sp. LMO-SS28 TaxID=3447455 RepID=UPI003EE3026E